MERAIVGNFSDLLVVVKILAVCMRNAAERGIFLAFEPLSDTHPEANFNIFGGNQPLSVYQMEVDDVAESLRRLGVFIYHLACGESELNHESYYVDGYSNPMDNDLWPLTNDLLHDRIAGLDDLDKKLAMINPDKGNHGAQRSLNSASIFINNTSHHEANDQPVRSQESPVSSSYSEPSFNRPNNDRETNDDQKRRERENQETADRYWRMRRAQERQLEGRDWRNTLLAFMALCLGILCFWKIRRRNDPERNLERLRRTLAAEERKAEERLVREERDLALNALGYHRPRRKRIVLAILVLILGIICVKIVYKHDKMRHEQKTRQELTPNIERTPEKPDKSNNAFVPEIEKPLEYVSDIVPFWISDKADEKQIRNWLLERHKELYLEIHSIMDSLCGLNNRHDRIMSMTWEFGDMSKTSESEYVGAKDKSYGSFLLAERKFSNEPWVIRLLIRIKKESAQQKIVLGDFYYHLVIEFFRWSYSNATWRCNEIVDVHKSNKNRWEKWKLNNVPKSYLPVFFTGGEMFEGMIPDQEYGKDSSRYSYF